jgi:nucleoside-diphosphate-sugar epimerase
VFAGNKPATGYVGGRLVPALMATDHQGRAVARTPGKLNEVPWRDRVEIVAGDLTDPSSVRHFNPLRQAERDGADYVRTARDKAGNIARVAPGGEQ